MRNIIFVFAVVFVGAFIGFTIVYSGHDGEIGTPLTLYIDPDDLDDANEPMTKLDERNVNNGNQTSSIGVE